MPFSFTQPNQPGQPFPHTLELPSAAVLFIQSHRQGKNERTVVQEQQESVYVQAQTAPTLIPTLTFVDASWVLEMADIPFL